MSYNKIIIMGRLTRDPELRFTPAGKAVCNLSVAVSRKWKDDAGNQKEEVAFVDCTAFAKTAEVIAQYRKKGGEILLDGRIRQENWTDKAGAKRSKLSVVVESFQLIGRQDTGASPEMAPAPEPVAAPVAAPAEDTSRDEVPF